MADHVIEVRRNGAGYEVAVAPPHPDHPAQTFETHKRAYGFAGGVRMVTGWARVDRTEESANGKPR